MSGTGNIVSSAGNVVQGEGNQVGSLSPEELRALMSGRI